MYIQFSFPSWGETWLLKHIWPPAPKADLDEKVRGIYQCNNLHPLLSSVMSNNIYYFSAADTTGAFLYQKKKEKKKTNKNQLQWQPQFL